MFTDGQNQLVLEVCDFLDGGGLAGEVGALGEREMSVSATASNRPVQNVCLATLGTIEL